jgi:sporulation protein YlmC with PRC-barrel domain
MRLPRSLPLALALIAVPHLAFAQGAAPTEGAPAGTPPIGTDTATATAPPAAKPVEGQIVLQGEGTLLVNDMLGSDVYSQTGESIGEISDLIVSFDGGVEGVVIGVGGFLGLGKKRVALETASLAASESDGGDLRLVTSATRADLEAAEPFLSRADLAAAQRALDAEPGGVPAEPGATN